MAYTLSPTLGAAVHYLLFIALCLIWGSSFILMKKAAISFGPLTIAGLRCVIGALLLAGVWGFWRRDTPPRRSQVPWLLLTVILGYGYPYSVQPYLVARHGSGFIGMMVSFVPLLTILASMPLLRVFPTRWQLLGVLGGLGCIGVVMADGFQRSVPAAQLVMAVSVPASYALANTLIKQRLSDIAPLMLALLGTSLSGLFVAPAGFVLEPVAGGSAFWFSVACLVALGLFGTGVATVMFFKLIQDQGPLFAGLVTYIVPFGALLWGWADAEQVTGLQLMALAGVLVMVAIVQVDVARQAARARALPE